jgi:mRNA-degrading endonuclease toxin of MazEF toxin-antitoxin module
LPILRFGDIVEAAILDPNGRNKKPRPVIVITPDSELARAISITVVAISTVPPSGPLPESYFELPAKLTVHGRGHAVTGLKTHCWAKCDWRCALDKSEVLYIRGRVPGSILKKIAAYLASQTP